MNILQKKRSKMTMRPAIPSCGKPEARKRNISLANFQNQFWTRRMCMTLPRKRSLMYWPCPLQIAVRMLRKTRDVKMMPLNHREKRQSTQMSISPKLQQTTKTTLPQLKPPQTFHSIQYANTSPTPSSPPSYSTPPSHSISYTPNAKLTCNSSPHNRDGDSSTLPSIRTTTTMELPTVTLADLATTATGSRVTETSSFRTSRHRRCSPTTGRGLHV
mmetsp:Transcript_3790/g.7172  ORF Transcript_3790/g.7172 Transcript_3790/m.7172 type:complete len:216 (+) Transcript_3790:331-978(+)